MLIFVTYENKKMSKRKPNRADRERVLLLEEHEKRKVILNIILNGKWRRVPIIST
jgi:hypothetical protein